MPNSVKNDADCETVKDLDSQNITQEKPKRTLSDVLDNVDDEVNSPAGKIEYMDFSFAISKWKTKFIMSNYYWFSHGLLKNYAYLSY